MVLTLSPTREAPPSAWRVVEYQIVNARRFWRSIAIVGVFTPLVYVLSLGVGLGVHARGTRLQMEVMSIDELTVEASVRLLHVLDAPTVTSGAEAEETDDGDEGDEEIIDAPDDSAEAEAEAQAEAEAEPDGASDDSSATNDASNAEANDAPSDASDQHVAEPGR